MTTAEALLALQIGCNIQIEHWEVRANSYYYLHGQSVMYRCKEPELSLDFLNVVCFKDDFIECYPKQTWKLYDDSRSNTSDENWMQDQS
nr:MAG: hypothetical protein [Bacteriophage sp.]